APVGNNQVALSWSSGTPGFFGTPQGYAIYRLNYITPTPTPRFVATVSISQQSYNDFAPELTPGTVIRYQVGVVDKMGNTSDLTLSNSVTTLSVSDLPATPEVLPFTGSAVTSIFSWKRNPRADAVTNYSVYGYDWPTYPSATPVFNAPVTGTPTWVITFAPNPTPLAANNYYVVAQNAIGSSTPAFISGIPLPAYSVGVTLTPGTRQVGVTWNIITNVTPITSPVDSYGIYRSLNATNNFTPVATVPVTQPFYSEFLPTATAGVTYFYRVT